MPTLEKIKGKVENSSTRKNEENTKKMEMKKQYTSQFIQKSKEFMDAPKAGTKTVFREMHSIQYVQHTLEINQHLNNEIHINNIESHTVAKDHNKQGIDVYDVSSPRANYTPKLDA